MVLLMLSTSQRFMALPKDQEHCFLHPVALHRWSLGHYELFLLLCEASFSQKVPSLNLVWESDMVVGQLVVEMVMLGGVLKEGLARASVKRDEVLVEVMRQLDGLVILKGLVEDLEHLLKSSGLLNVLDGEVPQELPSPPSQRADDAQQAFSFTLGHPHLHHIDGESLPPFLVVRRCTTEQGDVGILGARRRVQASCTR